MAQAPFSNALNSKINSTTSTNPLQRIGGAISNWYNTKSMGSFKNPESPNYIRQPGDKPAQPKVTTPSVSTQTKPSTTSGSIQGATPSAVSTKMPVETKPVTPTSSFTALNNANNGGVDSTGTYRKSTYEQSRDFSQSSPFSGSIGTLGKISTTPNESMTTAQQGLQGIATNQTPQVINAQKDYNDFAQSNPYMLAAQHNPNVAADVASGRSALLGQTFGAVLGAKSQAVSNALAGQGQQITAGNDAGQLGLTGQGQQITAAQNAGELSKPQAGAAFFGSPVTGNVVGNGTGSSGNNLIDNAVENAVQMIKSGSSTSDAMTTLNNLGTPAQQALISRMRQFDPNWNITASNAIAQQNMTQGQQYQDEAVKLNTTLKQLDTLEPTVNDFLTKSGLNNTDTPFYNESINEYIKQLKNPADAASLNAMLADVKTYTAQILGSSGLNPTEVSATVNSFDPSLLNAEQLKSLLSNLRNLGQIRLQPLQETSKSSYGSGNPFLGGAATPSTSSTLGPQSSATAGSKVDNKAVQAIGGSILNLIGGARNIVSGVGGIAKTVLEL